ncbi:hypothetical protein GKE82_06110 [Conexibacter sp. W3-3-2]|uniref:VCBS repeat-containing protein n=1 Tax=Paraconexibacter algicola TaxID=2133960 RepID=A0A2T4UDN6_9ACTN|nr:MULTISPECIES: hypothetical protein [Solirubrobacterales]MTD43887.1 hypothetical protein [Conexibacter sp. W3-3-2]PTL55619.1 hypothetical protein C7Y72_18460 [Paraconexibacter algicola]
MPRPRRTAILAACLAAGAPATYALAQTTVTPEQETTGSSNPQAFFSQELQADAKTSSAIKRLLSSKAGFVDARSGFVDVTGDGKADAIVLVTMPGQAGTVALYLFSTDGGASGKPTAKLRAVFRSQQLYRATFKLRNGTLVVRTPVYAKGDEPQAPSKFEERDYVWDKASTTLRRTARREFAGPGATPPR